MAKAPTLPLDHPDRLLIRKEVADLFGVDPGTIYRWAKNPTMNFPKPMIGGGEIRPHKFWRRGDIQDWIESRRET